MQCRNIESPTRLKREDSIQTNIDRLIAPAEKQVERFAEIAQQVSPNLNVIYGDEELYELSIHNIKDIAIYTIDLEGYIQNWSSEAERLKGFSKDEVLNQHYSMFFQAEDIEAKLPEIEMEEAKVKGRYQNDGWRLRSDKSKFWADELLMRVYNKKGHHVGYCKTTRDASAYKLKEMLLQQENKKLTDALRDQNLELKKANERLESEVLYNKIIQESIEISEQRFRKLVEVTQTIVWSTSASGAFIDPQNSWRQFTGQSWEEHQNFGWLNAVHVDDQDYVLKKWAQAVSESSTYCLACRIWSQQDQQYRPIIVKAVPMYDSKGVVNSWVGSCLDIYDLKHAEEALRHTTETLDLALQASEVGTWQYEVESGHMQWDAQMYQLFGVPVGSPIETMNDVHALIHVEDRERNAELLKNCIEHNTDYRNEYRSIWRVDGSIHYLSTRGRIFQFATGVKRIIGVCWDMTLVRKLESERMTSIIQNEQNQKERARAAEAHKEHIQQIMFKLCHEIRNPLASLQGAYGFIEYSLTELDNIAKLIPSENNNSEDESWKVAMRENLKKVKDELVDLSEINNECCTHLKEVVSEMLERTRLDAGKVSLNELPFSPNQVLQELVKMQSKDEHLRDQNIKLLIDKPNDEQLVKGDRAKLKILLLNFLTNAIKYTEKGSIRISLQYQSIGDDKSVLQFSITDSGIGMTPQEQETMFKQFCPTNVDKSYLQSSGLGLSIAKGYIDLMGGKISVLSEKDIGTTCIIAIPFTNLTVEEKNNFNERPTSPLSEYSASTASPLSFKPTLLIADDSPINRKLISRLFEKQGFHCLSANNGKEALSLFQAENIDIILMDLEMPVMSGVEAAKEIRRLEYINSTPIIALSGESDPEQIELAYQSGINAYLEKPYNNDLIVKTVIDCLQKVKTRSCKQADVTSMAKQETESPRIQAKNAVLFKQAYSSPTMSLFRDVEIKPSKKNSSPNYC